MRDKLVIASLVQKFAFSGLSVALPYLVLPSAVFGQYALLISTLLIFSYIIEGGIGLRSITIPRSDIKSAYAYVELTFLRDLAAITLGILFTFTSSLPPILIAAIILNSSAISWQGLFRSTGSTWAESTYNLVTLVALGVAFLAPSYLTNISSAQDAFVYFALVPRIAGYTVIIVAALPLIRGSRIERTVAANHPKRIKQLAPYWIQTVSATATTNLDTIIASISLSSESIGLMKLYTTIIGIALVPADLACNYLITRKVNDDRQDIGMLFGRAIAYILSAGASLALLTLCLHQALPWQVTATYCVIGGIIVLLRVNSLKLATALTISGNQSTRTKHAILTNCIYWLSLVPASYILGEAGFIISMAAASFIQLFLYRESLNKRSL